METQFVTPIKKTKDVSTNDVITIPPSPFLSRLGFGTGVSVMQLVRSPHAGQIRSPWALKMLNKRVKPNRVYSDRLKAEADILKRMSHPNIVGFRAFGQAKILYLGMEACDVSLGDLIERRAEGDQNPFLSKEILKVALDISSALHYLHTKVMILHGDIKSYNILVNGQLATCKLCDFGVTLPLNSDAVVDKTDGILYYGTEAWSAPEVLNGEQLSGAADVWPLGLTLWEMMALMPPHSMASDAESTLDSSTLSEDQSIGDAYSKFYGTRPPIPANIPEDVYRDPLALFYCCTEHEPTRRPAAAELHAAAGDIMGTGCAAD